MVRNGVQNGLQRFLCRVLQLTGGELGHRLQKSLELAGVHFNAASGTPLSRLRDKERFDAYAQCMKKGLTVREAAEEVGLTLERAFRWRHRFLSEVVAHQPKGISGILNKIILPIRMQFTRPKSKILRSEDMWNRPLRASTLRPQSLFEAASDALIADIEVQFISFAPGDILSRHGDQDSPLMLVVSGQVQASRFSVDGREIGIAFFRAGESCGETAIILGAPAIVSVVAVTPAVVGLVQRAEARRLFSDVGVSKGLIRLLSKQVELVVNNHTALALPNAYSRVYAVLITVLEESSGGVKPLPEIPSQAAIALAANVSRETVSRAIKTLVGHGAIAKDGRRVRIIDRNLLQNLALTL